MKFRHGSAIAIGTFALAFGAAAYDTRVQMMDTNKDGVVSASEHAAGARRMFEWLDADRDGRVTAAEMNAVRMGVAGDPRQYGAYPRQHDHHD